MYNAYLSGKEEKKPTL